MNCIRLYDLVRCTCSGVLAEYGVRLVAVGNLDLCPPAVQAALRKAEELTKDNTKYAASVSHILLLMVDSRAIFNLCISYSSRDEMASAVEGAINEKLDLTSTTCVLSSPREYMLTEVS